MSGRSALIGHSGFVGGTLLRQGSYDDLFNSSNIEEIAGRSYDRLVCAGVSAVKWLANREPEQDRAGIERLTRALERVEAREFVLISTIDVYPDPASGEDETAVIDPSRNHAYGANRLWLEQWVRERFPDAMIVRLPALFGTGLKKNALFDLIHGNQLSAINQLGRFQWYSLRRLTSDITAARAAGLGLINLFGEPVAMQRVIDTFFPGAETGPAFEPAPRYDLQTRHARVFGGSGRYVLDQGETLEEMGRFIAEFRPAGAAA